MYYVISIILITSFLLNFIQFIYDFIINMNLNSYSYSELFISFQGGFVRRGLVGEILYQTYQIFSFPVGKALVTFCCIIFIYVFYFFYSQFKKQNICWWLLLSPLFLNCTDNIVRKDYLLYAILIFIVCLLRKSSRNILGKCIACMLVVLALLIHEAFIFWGFVLYAIILLSDKRDKMLNYSLVAIPIVGFAILCYFKGTTDTAHAIVDSWNSILPGQPLEYTHYNAIGAIGWDAVHTFLVHLRWNLSPSTMYGGMLLIPLFLIAAYYFFTNYMLYFSKGTTEARNAKRMEISLLFPVFCISLIPMLTILSFDVGRVFQYATISTFCAFLILPQQKVFGMFPGWYKTIVGRVDNWLNGNFPPTKTIVIFMLLVFTVNQVPFDLNSSWSESVIGSIISNATLILHKLANIFV